MKTHEIIAPSLLFVHTSLMGEGIKKDVRFLGELQNVFEDKITLETISRETIVYEVYSYIPVEEKSSGSLNFGLTHIHPGKVGQEYFMTKGHFHTCEESSEYYWGIEGEGVLILMDKDRNVWGEKMFPGSLHYIPGSIAHRVANTGNTLLAFGACWPSDAGHNYEEIALNGFSGRVLEIDGKPQLILS